MKKSERLLRDQATQLVIPTQEDFQLDLTARCRQAVQRTIQVVLDEELDRLVGAGPYQRSDQRVDVRNGAYDRRVVTTTGEVGVRVGRTRAGGSATKPLGRYRRRQREIDDAITETYVRGASTRDIAPITQALLGKRVERSTVSRVTRRLEDEVEALRNERLTEPITYLYLDATFIDARWARTVENVSALVAYGVGPDGHRRLLAVHIGTQESEASWAGLLRELVERGLTGVRLVIADAHAGLLLAVRKALPEAREQRCTVHLMRNVLAHVPKRHQKRIGRELVAVLHAASLVEAKKALRSFRDRFAGQFAEAVTCLEGGFDAATQYFASPEAHWLRVRTNNGLERLHGEIKRRTRAVGAFPDRDSALRLITAVALQSVSIWSDRVYLDMTLLDDHYAAAA